MGYALITDTDFSGYGRGIQVHPVNKIKPTAIKIKGSATLDNADNKQKMSISFTPMLTSNRGINWSIESGADYAYINGNGILVAKFNSDMDNAHDVVVKAVSIADSAITDTMTVSVKCQMKGSATSVVSISAPTDFAGEVGSKITLVGLLDGEEDSCIKFKQPVSMDTTASKPSTLTDKVTLVDNGDGTATVTLLTDDYLHQVKFEAYNEQRTTQTSAITKNINDFVIINAADSANSSELMSVFYGNGKCANADRMYQSEAYVITTQI